MWVRNHVPNRPLVDVHACGPSRGAFDWQQHAWAISLKWSGHRCVCGGVLHLLVVWVESEEEQVFFWGGGGRFGMYRTRQNFCGPVPVTDDNLKTRCVRWGLMNAMTATRLGKRFSKIQIVVSHTKLCLGESHGKSVSKQIPLSRLVWFLFLRWHYRFFTCAGVLRSFALM